MGVEIFWQFEQCTRNPVERTLVKAGVLRDRRNFGVLPSPHGTDEFEVVLLSQTFIRRHYFLLLVLFIKLTLLFVCFLFGNNSFSDEGLFEKSVNVLAALDFFVHHGLREFRGVNLVVAHAAVTYQIHKDVFPEFSALLHGCFERVLHFYGFLGIHVDDRGVDAFGERGGLVAMSVV